MTLPLVEKMLLVDSNGLKKSHVCGDAVTPVDYYLNCELNSALVLMQ
jgi:hypothetical protein